MKKKTALILATLLIAAGVSIAGDNPLVGTWEFVSLVRTADGTTTEMQAEKDGMRAIKIFSKTHFAVVSHGADGTFRGANAGSYVVKGETFSETLQNSSYPDAVGATFVHEFSVSGDLLTNSYGNAANGNKTKEVWKRVK